MACHPRWPCSMLLEPPTPRNENTSFPGTRQTAFPDTLPKWWVGRLGRGQRRRKVWLGKCQNARCPGLESPGRTPFTADTSHWRHQRPDSSTDHQETTEAPTHGTLSFQAGRQLSPPPILAASYPESLACGATKSAFQRYPPVSPKN